jgi:hypothetical protein
MLSLLQAMRLIKGRAKGDLVPVGQLQKLLTTMGEALTQQEALALCQEADPTSSVCVWIATYFSVHAVLSCLATV